MAVTSRSSARLAIGAALLAGLAALCASCGDDAEAKSQQFTLAVAADDAWSGPSIPDFALTERSGRTVKLTELAGQPFVLDFIFTTCSGPCPLMSSNMRALQDELVKSRAHLVSFSVDPPRDTPEALTKYAERFGAERERWLFLTGDEAQIAKVAAAVSLPMQRDPSAGGAVTGMQVAHATRFVVVDGKGLVRGMYDGTSPDGVKAAAARVRWLEANPSR